MKKLYDEMLEVSTKELKLHGGHYVSYTDLVEKKEIEIDGLTLDEMVQLRGKIELDNRKTLQSCM